MKGKLFNTNGEEKDIELPSNFSQEKVFWRIDRIKSSKYAQLFSCDICTSPIWNIPNPE